MPVPPSGNYKAQNIAEMARNLTAGKRVQNPTVTPAAPPKGYVDDLDFLNNPPPTKARPTRPMPPDFTKDMPPTRTTSTPIPATGPQYMKKGGSFKTTKMSTHEKNPKHKNCW
jgi:hypothetical protein